MPTARRNSGKTQRKRGDRGEAAAEALLVSKGAFVLARNYIGLRGELDLVVAFGDTVVVVEVRTRRAGTDDALGSISDAKRRAVVRATREYLEKAGLSERPVRFDVVALGRRGTPALHREDAFDATGLDA